jgi:AraC-like DNA-binding protein
MRFIRSELTQINSFSKQLIVSIDHFLYFLCYFIHMNKDEIIHNLTLLNGISNVPIRLFHGQECLWRCETSEILSITADYDLPLLEEYRHLPSEKPLLSISEFGEMWAVFSYDLEGDKVFMILGPVVEMFVSEEAIRQIVNSTDHPRLGLFLKMRDRVPYMQSTRFISTMSVAHYFWTNKGLDVREFAIRSRARIEVEPSATMEEGTKQLRRNNKRKQDTARFERVLLDLVRHGEVDKVAQHVVSSVGTIGVVSPNPLRQEKDMFIICTAIVSRAAIEGGIHPDIAFSLSNEYIESCERAKSLHSVKEQFRTMILDFTKRVAHAQVKRPLSPLMRRVIEYIYLNLGERIDTAMIAAHFGYSRSYFSRCFMAEIGMSIPEYATKERITRAKDLLEGSDESISDISNMIGIKSPSRFIVVFKHETGQTPLQYRISIKGMASARDHGLSIKS